MSLDPIYIFAMIGTAVFALSGAMAAARKELDIFGFIIVALLPAVGGGTVRDLMLGVDGVFWVHDLNYVYVSAVIAIIAFFQVHRLDGKRYTLLMWADAFGLALFTIMGTQAAMAHDVHPVMVVIMGMMTGTFGGLLRDVICNEIPLLLQKEIYALAAIAGSVVYLTLIMLGMAQNQAMIMSMAATLCVRGPAIVYGWSLPAYRPSQKEEKRMKIIAFGASNSASSINKIFASYVAHKFENADVEILDLNEYEIPLYSPEREAELGQPEQAHAFRKKLGAADLLVISFAEHNSNYTAAFKNLFDWCSRIDRNIFQDKPAVLLATSPGGRGAQTVLGLAQEQLPRFGCDVKATLSLGNFNDHFDKETGDIKSEETKQQITDLVQSVDLKTT